jgi:hypothetical protein
MGSDINLIIEEYYDFCDEYGWYNQSHYEIDHFAEAGEYPWKPINIYPIRNYDCFYALCGVRDTFCEDLPILSEPRGFPDDVCKFSKLFCDYYNNPNDYTTSYVLLSELYNHLEKYPFFTRKGYVTLEQAEEFKNHGIEPTSYCGYTTDKSAVLLKWKAPNPLFGLIEAIRKHLGYNEYYFKNNAHKIRILFAID